MPAIIGRPETLLSLFPGEAMGRLVNAMNEAIFKSFCDEKGKMKSDVTQAEVKERFTVCVKMARQLRGDLGWGLERIIGILDEVLICHLSKTEFKPSDRKCWVPSDGRLS
jgi:hypothetical protein